MYPNNYGSTVVSSNSITLLSFIFCQQHITADVINDENYAKTMKTIDSNGYDFKKSSLVYPDFQKMEINVDKP